MAVFTISEDLKVHGTITDTDDKVVLGGVEVSKNSAAAVGRRRTLNLIEGANITLTIAEDVGGDEIDVTIAAAGGDTAFDVTMTSATIDFSAIATTTVINVTEVGRLVSIGFLISDTLDTTCSATLDITIDGGTKRSFVLYNVGNQWQTGDFLPWAQDKSLTGGTQWEHFSVDFNINYAVSLLVEVDITNAANAGDEAVVKLIKGVAL